MTLRHLSAAAFVFSIVGCGAADDTTGSEAAPGTGVEHFSTAPDEPNHEEITAAGLSFLRPDILTALQAGNVATDVEFFFVNANHFDDCNFTGGAAVVKGSQAEAVAQLDPSRAAGETDLLVIRAFARSLHALQDFYAHTNWIELGGKVLVDSSLEAFPSLAPYSSLPSTNFVVIEGRKPGHAALNRDEAAAYPASARVEVKLGRKRAPGLISGTVDYEEGNFCPNSVAMTHDELNKDKSTNEGRTEQYVAARDLAILQTEHEWCRLRALARAKWGDAGVTRLETWLAPGAAPPSCR